MQSVIITAGGGPPTPKARKQPSSVLIKMKIIIILSTFSDYSVFPFLPPPPASKTTENTLFPCHSCFWAFLGPAKTARRRPKTRTKRSKAFLDAPKRSKEPPRHPKTLPRPRRPKTLPKKNHGLWEPEWNQVETKIAFGSDLMLK